MISFIRKPGEYGDLPNTVTADIGPKGIALTYMDVGLDMSPDRNTIFLRWEDIGRLAESIVIYRREEEKKEAKNGT
jgi:hypothetical protein